MTATLTDLEAFGDFDSARYWAKAGEAGATTSAELRPGEDEETPTASVDDHVWSGVELAHALTGTPRSSVDTSWTWIASLLAVVKSSAFPPDFDETWATRTSADSPPYDPPTSSPFQTIDERRSESEKVSELIELVRRIEELPFAQDLAKRLEELVCIAQEEAPDQSEMSSDSLRTFIRLLRHNTDLAKPGVVLTPSGNIRAQWRAAPNKLCAAEFLVDERVSFVVFAPDTRNARRTFRLSGLALPIENFMSAVELHGASQWMRE